MADTTRAVLTQRVSESVGDYEALTTTSSGSTTTLVATALADLTESDDGIQGWIEITDGNNDGEIRRIKGVGGYTASTTTITVNFAFSNTVGSGVGYILHRINPTDKHNAINRAIEALFPDLYLPIRDESLIVDSLVLNGSFETTLSAASSVAAVERARVGRVAAFVVAASNASELQKSQADFLCDGTADEVDIELAIAALPSVGGTIYFSEGTFNLAGDNDRNLDITKSNVRLVGMGMGITTLKAATKDAHLISNSVTTLNSLTIQDMTLDHDGVTLASTQGHLVRLERVTNVVLENLELLNSTHHGIATLPDDSAVLDVNTDYFINNIYAKNIGVAGIVGGDAIRIFFGADRAVISNIVIDGVENHGIHVGLGQQTISNVTVLNAGAEAVSIQSEGAQLTNIDAEWNITSDLIANRPAAGTAGNLFLATDEGTTGKPYRDNGSAWQALSSTVAFRGLRVTTRTNYATAQRITISNVKLILNLTETATYLWDEGDGITVTTLADNVLLNNIHVRGKFRIGAVLQGDGTALSNALIDGVRQQGILIAQSTGGPFLDFGVMNVHVRNAGQQTSNTYDAIVLQAVAQKARIIGCRVEGSAHRDAIREISGTLNNVIMGNHVDAGGTGAITKDPSSNSIVRGNLNSTVDDLTADPGDGNAIAVINTGHVPLVTTGAETRTVADARAAGLTLDLYFKTDGGDCVVTTASPCNQAGNNTLTFADAGDHIRLQSIEDGSDFEWRVVANDGVALSTV
jgi:hypothetical protein